MVCVTKGTPEQIDGRERDGSPEGAPRRGARGLPWDCAGVLAGPAASMYDIGLVIDVYRVPSR